MIFARVVGNIVATQKNENLRGSKLMILQPLDTKGKSVGKQIIAVDAVGAGIGDIVVAIAEGGSARQVYKAVNPMTPIDTVIAGIVDIIETEDGSICLYD
ncbi:MAG: EutN/CcmL family microcompartment protein [Clostridia bacterium]|nr:EutN/CcmL family microcompartment protein [Clostridia bacterium]